MGGNKKIDCYLDVASFFSYIAFAELLPNLETLAAHGVEVEFHPVLIAGINQLSGNSPPWKLKAKAAYLSKDSKRAQARVGKPHLAFPRDFLSMAMTASPLRALLFVKANFPAPVFLAAMHHLFESFWAPPHANLTVDEVLREALAGVRLPSGGGPVFGAGEVGAIMDGREAMKGVLRAETERAVELGAFGAPWIWAVNADGKGEAFFGSDRFNHVYKYLGVPFQDVALLPPDAKL
ncbi:hypothetical protein N3K66_001550 [Trichothecium roseum]|uniref:Uncharacterized protein n=1 Tax=Trichothecium roseum TaxID=47278 RepID=A0ACC0VEY0_9HYPO|nr:hypothetical protein N3K66_001550 [Trichothecium roseum]